MGGGDDRQAAERAAGGELTLSLDDFFYDLPGELIAQRPAKAREGSRLMVVDRAGGVIRHSRFTELAQWLPQDSLLAVNDARVVPARLWGRRETGGRIETLILEPPRPGAGPGVYEIECLARPSRRLRPGVEIIYGPDLRAEVVSLNPAGQTRLRFFFDRAPGPALEAAGRMPLPPYIKRAAGGGPEADLDRERYQTVYARTPGAVAAPTAGLHFASGALKDLQDKGFEVTALTLLVGYGTFAPVREKDITRRRMHEERLIIPAAAAQAVNRAKAQGRDVIAVGTTVVRSLESAGQAGRPMEPCEGMTDLFIYPGFEFKVVDHLLTNFHLPGSTLLMLVSALAGRETILEAYRLAVAERYRFFSYGDAMLIL